MMVVLAYPLFSVMKKLLDGISVRCNVWNKPNDTEQTRYLEPRGYKVIRFWNNQVEYDTPALPGTAR